MDRYLVISSDCHAGLRPEEYRGYLDPQYREALDTEKLAPLVVRIGPKKSDLRGSVPDLRGTRAS